MKTQMHRFSDKLSFNRIRRSLVQFSFFLSWLRKPNELQQFGTMGEGAEGRGQAVRNVWKSEKIVSRNGAPITVSFSITGDESRLMIKVLTKTARQGNCHGRYLKRFDDGKIHNGVIEKLPGVIVVRMLPMSRENSTLTTGGHVLRF